MTMEGARKGCGKVREQRERERERERNRSREKGGRAIAGVRTRREAERERGWFRWAPSKNPSVILNNKDPPAHGASTASYPLPGFPAPRQSFTLAGGHRSSQWPSYPSTPATCPGNDHRPGPALFFHSPPTRFRISRGRGEEKRQGRDEGTRRATRAHVRHLAVSVGLFAPSPSVTSRVARDCYRLYPCKPSLDRLDGQPPSSSSLSLPGRPMAIAPFPLTSRASSSATDRAESSASIEVFASISASRGIGLVG